MAKIGRPKIEGLERFSLRLVRTQLAQIDVVVDEERERRGDPALNRTDIIREALLDNRPVTYGGNGHSILIYGASYDATGTPLKYFIKDSYPDYFYEAAPRKLHAEMLEVTLVVRNLPTP